jgi:hypothetical protein
VSVNFSHNLPPLLGFLIPEDGTDKLTQNFCKKLPIYAAKYFRRAQTSHDDLAMQALAWLCVVWF